MCLPYINIAGATPCEPNSIGLIAKVNYIPRADIVTAPAEAASPTLISQNGKLTGAFTLETGKFWKSLPIEVEVSEFMAEGNFKGRSGNYKISAPVKLSSTSEDAIGTMNQMPYDDVVVVIHATSGKRYVIGLGASSKVNVAPALKTQNTESSDGAGIDWVFAATSPKVYFLDSATALVES